MIYTNSRYRRTSAIKQTDGSLIFKIRKRFIFNPSKFTYYTFIQGDTIDGIAFKLYENAQLNWVILDANPQYLTEMDIKAGDILNIPDYSEVVKFFG